MKATFPNYNLRPEEQSLIELIEATGFDFVGFETSPVQNEEGFNKLIAKSIYMIQEGYSETVSMLEKRLYNTRTIGPYEPYPQTPKNNG